MEAVASGSATKRYGSLLKVAEKLSAGFLRLSLFVTRRLGRNMTFVAESGRHSKRNWAFQLFERLRFLLMLFENWLEPKFSVAERDQVSPSL